MNSKNVFDQGKFNEKVEFLKEDAMPPLSNINVQAIKKFRQFFLPINGEQLCCWKLATMCLLFACLFLLLTLIVVIWMDSNVTNQMGMNHSELKQMIKNATIDILRTQTIKRDDKDNFWDPYSSFGSPSSLSAVVLSNQGLTLYIKRSERGSTNTIQAYWPFNITTSGPKIVHYFEVKIVRNNYWPHPHTWNGIPTTNSGGTIGIGIGSAGRHFYFSDGAFTLLNGTAPRFDKEGSIVGCGLFPLFGGHNTAHDGYQVFFTNNGELLEPKYTLKYADVNQYLDIVPTIVFHTDAGLEMEIEANFGWEPFLFKFYKLWFKEEKSNNGSIIFPDSNLSK